MTIGNSLSPPGLRRTIWPALLFGIGASALVCFGGWSDGEHFFRAYLVGWLICLSAAMGAMGMVMMHHLTGGEWGWLVRRPGEAAAATLPYVAIGFVPLAIGARFVFPWADAQAVEHDEVLRHRQVIFNTPFTLGRAAAFLIAWSCLGALLGRWSSAHDRTGDEAMLSRLRKLSALGLVFYFITMSLAGVDWIASREVDWYSSTFGLVSILGQAITGLSILIVAVGLLRNAPPLEAILEPKPIHDLGNLLQTTVILWAYVSFAQYLVIWSGNMQEDITWFHHRTGGAWNWVGISLIVLHFGLPFVLLLFQRAKRNLTSLALIAAGVVVMRVVDVVWMVVPSNKGEEPSPLHWLDLVAVIALGGLWWACFAWQLGPRPLVPLARQLFVPEPQAKGDDVGPYVQPEPLA